MPPAEAIHEATVVMMEAYATALAADATLAYLGGQARASKLIRIPFSFNLVNSNAMALMAEYRNNLIWRGGSNIDGYFVPWLKDMATEARDKVTQIVEEGIRTGTPLPEVKSALDDVFTMQEHRSQLVAYQETRRMFNQGTMDRFKEEGIQEFIWHHMDPQAHPRPEHQSWDGQVFNSYSLPSLDEFNCHCWVEPVTGHNLGGR